MPLPREVAGKATKTATLDQTGYYAAGDYVVAEFSENGSKTAPGQVVGEPSNVISMSKKMAEHALMGGAEPLPILAPVPTKAAKRPGRPSKAQKAGEALQEKVDKLQPLIRADGLASADLLPKPPLANDILPPPSPTPSLRSIEVVFSTQLGRIKVNTLAVLEDQNALILVFKDESEIRYEPAPGTNVQLIVESKLTNTMYPGFKLTWMDGKMILMVFVKVEEE